MADADDVEMNSRAFWENYFQEEWDENDGGGQTRHFMRHLLGHLPPAVLGWMQQRPLDVLDWGCAYGEGVVLLAQSLPDAAVRGLDFSRTAIDEARLRYPWLEFQWTEDGTIPETQDVIVTSNCLEHFEDPLEVMRGHLRSCRSVYAALVPYKEAPLHEQHVAQFRLESFPEEVDGWRRVAALPIEVDNAYWPGWQLLAVYVSPEALGEHPELALDGTAAEPSAVRAAGRIHLGVVPFELDAVEQRNRLIGLAQQVQTQRAAAERDAEELASLRQLPAQLEAAHAELESVRTALRQAEERAQAAQARARAAEGRAGAETERASRLEQEADDRVRAAEELVEQRSRALERLSTQLAESTRLLRREETSVARPVLRRAVRAGRVLGRRLPPERQQDVRAVLAPVVTRLAPRSAQASVYARAKEVRGGVVRPMPAPEPGRPDKALPDAPRPDALDIVVLPVIDWHFRHQRPQQIATHLANAGHRVVYLTTTFDRPRPGSAMFSLVEHVQDRVVVARLVCPDPQPVIYADRLNGYQAAVVANALRELSTALDLQRVVLLTQHPFWRDVLQLLPEHVLVYDLMDDHEGFDNTADWVLEAERQLLASVDLTTVTAPTLQERVPGRSVLVRNGAEVEQFQRAARARTSQSSDRLRVGYVGAIAHWFDTALVRACAEAHPEWDFVLVGDTTGSDATTLDDLANVDLLGERPYQEVPDLVAGFDVCLIPFLVIPLTEHTNPVKAYEYLAAGKPVVATAMPEVVKMAPHVHVARDVAGFLEALQVAADEAGDAELASRRQEWAAQHSWDARATTVAQAVSDLYVPASVVVLCYGNLDLTKACVSSLERHTRYLAWELVLVDNKSPDDTRDWLRSFANGKGHVVVVENDENLGFAGGNNAGVRASRGDVVVLLNNDTYVTDGWLHGLVRHLRDDETIGLVGPVTNNIGNEARIDIQYGDMAEMGQQACEWTSRRARRALEVDNVAFFCVAMRRTTWDSVGELDERFGLGFFEDDDYCRRVREAGMRVLIAEDVFVHHHLSASFDVLGASHKRALFEHNRQLFEEKWGQSWSPHIARTVTS